jgi:hypothetical protein
MNDAFHDAYVARRAAALAAAGPVILHLGGDRLVLLRNGERLEALVTNARYHELKSMAHVVFALFLMLAPVDGAVDDALAAQLTAYRTLLRRAEATIEGRFGSAAQRDRQRRILDRALALLDAVVVERRLPRSALRRLVEAERADVIVNVREAAREEVTLLHAQVEAWKARMSAAELSRLRVVIDTAHMARPGNLAVQYFQAALGEPYAGRRADERVAEGERVIVTESGQGADRALALLGAHLVDRSAAEAFFGDPLRLDRDLLSDGAEDAIRELLGRTPDGARSHGRAPAALQRLEAAR